MNLFLLLNKKKKNTF